MKESFVLENAELLAEISLLGGELIRLYDKKTDREILWSGDPRYWKRHAPVLFPFVGKLREGSYRFSGKSYEMLPHGFARDQVFRVLEEAAEECCLGLSGEAGEYEAYPFAFQLMLHYRLLENRLRLEAQVLNPDKEKALYFSFGWHPGFSCEQDKEGMRKDFRIRFPGKKELTVLPVNPVTGLAHPEESYSLDLTEECLPVHGSSFQRDALVMDGSQLSEAVLLQPDGDALLSFRFPGAKTLGIWSAADPGAPFVCLEPWWGRCDDADFSGELPEKPGINRLSPGEAFFCEMEVGIYRKQQNHQQGESPDCIKY